MHVPANNARGWWQQKVVAAVARLREFRSERGDAAVELALVMALMGPVLLLGTTDLATVAYCSIEVTSAAHAGAMYGMRSGTYASSTSGMTTAAQAEAADFGTNLTVTPTTFYACSAAINGTTYTTQSAANTGCTGSGNHALQFVQVLTSGTVTPMVHFPALPASYLVSGTSIMEVEE